MNSLIIALEFYSQLFLLIVVSLFAVRSAKSLYVVLKGCFPQVLFRVLGFETSVIVFLIRFIYSLSVRR